MLQFLFNYQSTYLPEGQTSETSEVMWDVYHIKVEIVLKIFKHDSNLLFQRMKSSS